MVTIEIVRGDNWALPIQWRRTDGTGIDITGYEVRGRLLLPDETIYLTVENGRVHIVDPVQGKWRYSLNDEETSALKSVGSGYLFKIGITDTLGAKQTLTTLSADIS